MALTLQEFKERTRELLSQEREQPCRWFYCSFADSAKGGFLGAAVVRAHGIVDCGMTTHHMGINPGGEMLAIPMPEEILPPDQYRNKLLSKKEVAALWPDSKTLGEWQDGPK